MQDRKTRSLTYNSIILLLAKQNYDIYRRKLIAIIKFTKKYLYILNIKYQSIIHTDNKLLVGFFNAKYHKDIFIC